MPGTSTPGWSERSASPSDAPARPGRLSSLFWGAAGAALVGLLHAAAGGALVLAGLNLAIPGLLDAGDGFDGAAQATTLGLAALRVPLESGDVHGTFAPLSGLLLTLWGLASAVRRSVGEWPGRRVHHIAATGGAFALTCAGAAAVAGAVTTLDASLPGAALAGFVWGSLAAAWATRRGGADRPSKLSLGAPRVSFGPPEVAPGLVAACIALALGAAWFLVAAFAGLLGSSPRELAGGMLLAIAVAPNAGAALVAVGLGASAETVLTGTALAGPLRESVALWDWAGTGVAPPHVLFLVLVPLVAVVVAGRLAANIAPRTPQLLRGLHAGAALGPAIVLAGWAGSLAATSAAAGETVSIRLGFPALTTFALAHVWGVAGAYLGPRLPWPARGGRGSRVSAS